MHDVALISGKDDNHAVLEYLGSIVATLQEKVAVIMASSHFFSLLSDGSQKHVRLALIKSLYLSE